MHGQAKGNFEADWIAQLRTHLTQVQGWDANEVASLDDRDVRTYFFEARRRKLAPRARVLKVADDFQCSPTESTGWEALQNKVRKGEDLNPHLSNRHASLFNNDGLLAEWGVHHFHLGIKPDPKNPAYTERTGPLVYVLVDDLTFCAINIYPHGSWEELSIIESIHLARYDQPISSEKLHRCNPNQNAKAGNQKYEKRECLGVHGRRSGLYADRRWGNGLWAKV